MEKTSNNKPRSVSNTVLGVQEFLVLVEYLFRCTDKNHQTSQKEINEYLIDKYGFDIRRDRINDIYEALYQFCKTNKDFGVNIVKEMHGRCARYYLESRSLSNEDLVAIGSSMRNDKYLSTLNADKYIDLLVKQFACKYQEEEIKKQIEDADKEIVKLSKLEEENLKKLSVPEADKYLFKIEIKSRYGVKYSIAKQTTMSCYLYDVVESNNQLIAYFLDIKRYKLFAIPLGNFTINEKPIYMGADMPNIDELFHDFKKRTLKEYVSDAGVVTGGMITRVSFDVKPDAISYVAESYHKFFKKDMPYKEKEYVARKFRNHEIIKKIYSVNVRLDTSSFMKWVEDEQILSNISNLKPSLLLRNIANKYSYLIGKLVNEDTECECDLRIFKKEEDGNKYILIDEAEDRRIQGETHDKLKNHYDSFMYLYGSRLRDYFIGKEKENMTLSFEDIEKINGHKMPEELMKSKYCWEEVLLSGFKQPVFTPWERGGYVLAGVDLENKKVSFVKEGIEEVEKKMNRFQYLDMIDKLPLEELKHKYKEYKKDIEKHKEEFRKTLGGVEPNVKCFEMLRMISKKMGSEELLKDDEI